jgi:hypothetical protein
VRQILQERLEQEVTAALGRLRHGRAEAVMRIQSAVRSKTTGDCSRLHSRDDRVPTDALARVQLRW